jgi:fructose-specific PTS system IIA-like component
MLSIAIDTQLKSSTKEKILGELAQIALKNGNTTDAEGLLKDLLAREREDSTGFGNNIAIPHAKSDKVTLSGVIVGRSLNKVDWNSIDGEPVNVCVCLLTPLSGNEEHLRLLSKLSRKMVHSDFLETLKHGDAEAVVNTLKEILQ